MHLYKLFYLLLIASVFLFGCEDIEQDNYILQGTEWERVVPHEEYDQVFILQFNKTSFLYEERNTYLSGSYKIDSYSGTYLYKDPGLTIRHLEQERIFTLSDGLLYEIVDGVPEKYGYGLK